MKTGVEYLKKYLEKDMTMNYALKNSKLQELCLTINKNHNIPIGRISDLVVGRVSIEEANDFELFCLTYYINKNLVEDYFTKEEIKRYSETVLPDQKQLHYPIRIHCIKVTEDSYIGSTDVNFLMELRENQKINYNKNTQRNMDMVVRGEHKYYKISLNKGAVKNIKEAFKTGRFISNTITLNLPLDRNNEFYYDDKTNELVITKLDMFDITDGYHRYVAMGQVRDENHDWNYPMELRITNFSEDKMKTFIFQEDQKTQMKKIDSDSMNMYSQSNIVTERLNNDTKFFYTGNIQRNGGLISFSELSSIIYFLYFKKEKNTAPSYAFKVQQEIRESWNLVAVAYLNANYVEHTYTFMELCILLYGIRYSKEMNIMEDKIFEALNRQDELDKKKFSNKTVRQTLFTDIEKLYKG